jgi:2-amino-4-hydroxy-6-hydroxymethyldihydropteridine diphosphokinase
VALVYLSLGSNQGDPAAILDAALAALDRLPDTRVTAVSHRYRTAPVGFLDQPHFLNLVAAVETTLPPPALLEETQRLEREAGRVRGTRWGPRTLDIDLVWYHGVTSKDERLRLPHPRMEERRFVLEPLAELAPGLLLAGGRTVEEALEAVAAQQVERIDTP